jgi:putative ABC transport system substrate-binding protein
MIKRRQFIAGLGSAAAWPLAARAQQPDRVRQIGVLILGSEADPIPQSWAAAFRKALNQLGWREDRNLRIDLHFAPDVIGIRAAAEHLVSAALDVIVVHSSPAASAIRQQIGTIPLVFVAVGDPQTNGLVENIARPEGNVTGFTNLVPTFGGKWVGLLKEAARGITRVGLLFNPEFFFSKTYFAAIEQAASTMGVEVVRIAYRDPAELMRAADAMGVQPNGSVILLPPISIHSAELVSRLLQYRLPSISSLKPFVTSGGLMSYGANNADLFRRAALYVDRILHGVKPGDLPVQFPTKFELVINLKTAKALGLTIPETLLATADEVIQ